jgi:tetratricopeptide (TPR) repeat protein
VQPQPEAITAVEKSQLVAMIGSGRYAELESRARELTHRHPSSGFAWKALGVSLSMQHKDALQALRTATQLLPDDAEAHANLAVALLDLGRLDEAVASYQRALEIKSDYVDAHINLGNALRSLGRLDEAVTSYRSALVIDPGHAEVHNNLGLALRSLGRSDDAVASYREALANKPNYAEAHGNLGNALLDLGRLDDAVASYRRALEIKPDLAEAHNNLGNALLDLGQLDEAVASYGHALAIKPDYAEAHSNLGIALRLQGRTDEAEVSCRRALEFNPALAAAITVLADAHADKGQFTQAEQLFRRAIAVAPQSPEAWAGIAHLRKMTASDAPWLAAVQGIAATHLPPRKEILLRYALGKYFDDVQDFDQAFLQYQRANQLAKHSRVKHDRLRVTQAIDQLIQTYDRNYLDRMRVEAAGSARAVIIVGMPRSGTSLAEQILASHPAVFGAGELTFWNTAATTQQTPAHNAAVGGSALATLAGDYLRLLERISPDALRVVDKMPANFLHVGLIRAALPNAHIIHMRRNPIDTCLSIYFQDFKAVLSYANDLGDLGHFYAEYLRLMKHWQMILPEKAILEVPYEGLVQDQEAWSRQMLQFIGLPWDPRCLDFHRINRSVTTASKWQVRQKISGASVARWRNYDQYIGPLRALLDVTGS